MSFSKNFLAKPTSKFTSNKMFQNYKRPFALLTEFDLECHEVDRYNDATYDFPSSSFPLYEVRNGTDMYDDMLANQEFPLSTDMRSAFESIPLQRNYAVSNGKQEAINGITESSSVDPCQTPPPGYESPDSPPRITRRSMTYPKTVIPGTPVPPLTLDDTRIPNADWLNSTYGNDFVEMQGQYCGNGLFAPMLMHTRMHEPLTNAAPIPRVERPKTPVNRPARNLSLKDQQIADLKAANHQLRKKLRASEMEQRRLRKKNQDFSRNLREFSVELDIKFDALDDAEVEDVVFLREVPSAKRKLNTDLPEEVDQEMIDIAKHAAYMAKKRARKAKEATHEL